MKTYKVFLYYWILTLLFGSALLGIFDVIIYNKGSDLTESTKFFFGSTIMGIYYSVISSILPLICLLILNYYYKKTEKLSVRGVLIIKLVIIIITFLTLLILDNSKDIEFYVFSFFCYGLIGFFFWWREFKRIESKSS